MTKDQRKHVSLNSKKQANDGRNKVFCYDIVKKITIQCSSLVTLGIYLNINIGTSSIKNILVAKRYIVARTLSILQNKINTYNSKVKSIKFVKKVTEEAIQDIRNGMSQRDWTTKYSLCKATYF